jgi:hypothetical protein
MVFSAGAKGELLNSPYPLEPDESIRIFNIYGRY